MYKPLTIAHPSERADAYRNHRAAHNGAAVKTVRTAAATRRQPGEVIAAYLAVMASAGVLAGLALAFCIA